MRKVIALALTMTLAGLGSTSLSAFQATTQPVTRPAPQRPVPLPQPVPDRPVPLPRPDRPSIQPPRPIPPRPIPPRPPRPRPPVVVNPGFGVAVLYGRTGYRGNYLTVRRSIPDLRRVGFDDRAASLRGGGRWQVCSRTHYRGNCLTVRAPRSSFGRLNGNVSSIRYLGR